MSAHFSRYELIREDIQDVTVVLFTAPRLEEKGHIRAVFQEVACFVAAGRHHLVLNLRRVEYLGSRAINELLRLHRRVRAAHGRLALCHLSPATDEALKVLGLKEVVPTYGDEEEALRSISA
jgi:anti-anti-sigma factor